MSGRIFYGGMGFIEARGADFFEMESEFGFEFSPNDIAKLYSNTNVIIEYLHNGLGR